MTEEWNAYANKDVRLEPLSGGPLSGLTFAIKDVFAIAGVTSGAGNPDWLRAHEPAKKHAAVIEMLLGCGAALRGTTITDELMYSINGENAHYGTPRNPNAPGRIPGGSSSGSAVAAAAGLADFTVGTDTGGSVRVPAAYCGVYGIRPTHGSVSADGLIPLAPDFDTVGWMARDAGTLRLVGSALFGTGANDGIADRAEASSRHGFTRILVARDMWSLADAGTQAALSACLPLLRQAVSAMEEVTVAPQGLSAWMNAFRILQGAQIWMQHGEWIAAANPRFGPGIAERFQWASTISEEEQAAAAAIRKHAVARMTELLDGETIIIAPTVPSVAPPLGGSGEEVETRRGQTLQLCCVAGLSGLPQATLPLSGEGGMPIGLSFIAGRGHDLRLLQWLEYAAKKLA
ncbi:amidase [Paenibacillus nanensis]|uniref:Amidase n=1 Tax=Paenibacillus nanensis TaxID=393251 RepID=A0A3A1UUS6_9BACL|nr:amidase [Paenibacillus nanensis]RIX51516.1 amidase [Paenibacillus nanensis]